MASEFESALQQTDWNVEWGQLQAYRQSPGDAAYWDSRAHSFDSDRNPSDYREEFMRLADVRPEESLFDMGCGTGSLAIAYAAQGHRVLAADFSANMLAEANKRIAASNLSGIQTRKMSWQDDWQSCGVEPKSFDVAIASRSIATDDLRSALLKLDGVARRRCCITLTVSGSPRIDARVLVATGIERFHGRDFQYAFNILVNEGRLPSCEYIRSTRKDTFDSSEEALAHFLESLAPRNDSDSAVSDQQAERLREWLSANLVENEAAGQPDGHGSYEKRLRLKQPRSFFWAFLSWDPNDRI